MLSSFALLTFLQDGPLPVAVVSDEGVITLVSRSFEMVTGMAAGEPAPAWLSGDGQQVTLGDRHFEVWIQGFAEGRLAVLRDRTDLRRAEDRLWEKHTHLAKVAAQLSVRERVLLLATEKMRQAESEKTALQSRFAEEIRQREMTAMLQRHLGLELAKAIAASPTVDLGAHKSIVTVFYADLSSADEIISEMEAEEMIDFLNEYIEGMSQIVFASGGTLDKTMGTRIKGFFGDPTLHEDHAARAVRTALEMRERVRLMRPQWFPARDEVDLLAGVHTGYATVGSVGTGALANYMAVGKNVIFAGALQMEARPGQVLLSARTHDAVRGQFYVESLQVTLRGSSRPVTVWNVRSEKRTVEISPSLLARTAQLDPEQSAVLGPGRALGPYVVQERIGEGGMGVVYKGFDERLKRVVALKVLAPALASDERLVARFKKEARALASLNSPHIAQIYFISDEENPPFFAMEFIEGSTLRQVISEQGTLPLRRSLKLLTQIARGLQAAAESGVIHRDVKPDNVIVTTKGQAKITDFGLVKSAGEDSGMTAHGMVLGTPLYMSPEQARGQEVDLRSDIYSLGATFFHMLAGEPPFKGESALAIMRRHEEAPLPPLADLPRSVSPNVYDVIVKMMAKTKEDRFQDYDVLLEAIEGC